MILDPHSERMAALMTEQEPGNVTNVRTNIRQVATEGVPVACRADVTVVAVLRGPKGLNLKLELELE